MGKQGRLINIESGTPDSLLKLGRAPIGSRGHKAQPYYKKKIIPGSERRLIFSRKWKLNIMRSTRRASRETGGRGVNRGGSLMYINLNQRNKLEGY